MPETHDYRAMYEAHQQEIERILAYFCRRWRLRDDDAQEFAAWARAKLVADDYAVFRKYQGRSRLTTYLSGVVANLSREYNVAGHGRWRPSAPALRRGELAVRLEQLVHGQGLRWGEAVEVVRSSAKTDLPDSQLVRMIAELPRRDPLRPSTLGEAALEETPAPGASDAAVLDADADSVREKVFGVLFRAIARLPAEDQVAIRMRFWEGMKVTDVARGTQRDPKRLFKRIDRVMVLLRRELESAGISREVVRELLDGVQP
jgi:DNA-directed RNA polymerase specialized sigma24 family protein